MAEQPLFKTKPTKEEEKRTPVAPVVNGAAKVKKKSEVRKFTDIFLAEDVSNVKSYVLMDVLVPAVKKAVSDIVTNGIDMILYGETGHSRKSGASKVSYGSYYKDRERGRRDYAASHVRGGIDYDDIIFETRGDAESVLSAMEDIIEQFRYVSVADLYDLAQVSTTNYAINKYGWTDLHNASVVRVRDGFAIKLPRALPLD